MINQSIKKLVCYGLEKKLFTKRDEIFVTNRILEILQLDSFECETEYNSVNLEETLGELLDFAVENGLIEDSITHRDLFDTKLMNCLMPRPAQVQAEFAKRYESSPVEATDYFYKLSQDSDYIRRYRIKKDVKWVTPTEYGDLDITSDPDFPQYMILDSEDDQKINPFTEVEEKEQTMLYKIWMVFKKMVLLPKTIWNKLFGR